MKVINFFGAPGAGKTTTATGLVSLMKMKGYKAEIVLETAKDFIFSGSAHLLSHQNYVFAQQEHRLRLLLENEVDYAIMDGPLLLAAYYAPANYPKCFNELCFTFFHEYENINFFLTREHKYIEFGRLQNELESNKINKEMKNFLINNSIPFIEAKSTEATAKKVLDYLKKNILSK